MHPAPTLGDKRADAAILQSKLPKIMQMPTYNPDPVQMESDAWRVALWKRLQFKNLIIAAVAEFVGTFLFLFFALAINTRAVNAAADATGIITRTGTLEAQLFSSLGFGFSLCISAWVFFRISGGVQNPAITLALTLTGAMSWKKCIVLSMVQNLAGIAAAGMVSSLLPGQVNARTTIASDVTVVQAFFLEFFLTCQLIFTVLMLAAEKHKATFLAPVGIGLALFITQMLGQSYTGASVNPARWLGPELVTKPFSFQTRLMANGGWIYYVAPYLAAVVTAGFYWTLKWARYETTSPDQDADENRAGTFRQVILDSAGNVVGTLETVDANEYNVAEEAAMEQTHVNQTLDTGFYPHIQSPDHLHTGMRTKGQ
ncbi:hypothetical protein CBS101457_004368 [Exobasidium rhododendri]|nr:hypothetical protein CBS101457_004368 [Exobasidium rhododendri]